MPLTLNQYQIDQGKTKFYPNNSVEESIIYCALSLAGEAGELANKVKKHWRDHTNWDEFKEQAIAELGDNLWYISALASELGVSLELVADLNLDKLIRRSKSNTLKGSGDNR